MKNIVKAADKWLENHPFLTEIAALHLACNKAVENCDVIKDMPDNIDEAKEQYSKGVSLLHCGLDFHINEKAGNILLSLNVLKDELGLPEPVRNEAEKLNSLSKEKSNLLISSLIKNDEETFKSIIKEIDGAEDIITYFAWVSIRKALSGIKEQLENFVSENIWQKGQCPVCSQEATTAFFKHTKRGRQRFLHCDHCGTEWAYKRIGCPYCENIDQKKMSIKDSEDEPDMRIDLCHKCMSYIKTYIGEDKFSAGKDGWAGIHLDILMKDTGFTQKGSLIRP